MGSVCVGSQWINGSLCSIDCEVVLGPVGNELRVHYRGCLGSLGAPEVPCVVRNIGACVAE